MKYVQTVLCLYATHHPVYLKHKPLAAYYFSGTIQSCLIRVFACLHSSLELGSTDDGMQRMLGYPFPRKFKNA